MRFSPEPNEAPKDPGEEKRSNKIIKITSLDDLPPPMKEELKRSKATIVKMLGMPEPLESQGNFDLLDFMAFQNVQISALQKEIKMLLQEIIPQLAAALDEKADRVTW